MATSKGKTPPPSTKPILDPILKYNVETSRLDTNAFIEFVMVDEHRKHLRQAPLHENWQSLFKEHQYLSLWSAVSSGKTSQITGFLLDYMGRYPDHRIVYVSKNDAQAKKTVSELERYIQSEDDVGERLHLVYPHLVPGTAPQDEWSAFRFTIDRPNKYMKDPTLQAFGLGGNPTGSRSNLIVLDDLLTAQSTATPGERDKAWNYIITKLISRLEPGTGRIISIGTPFHPDDVLHRIEADGDEHGLWHTYKFPAIDGKTWDVDTIAWPERWSLESLRKQAILLNDPGEFARQMLCEARDEGSSLFKADHVQVALERGLDYELVREVSPLDLLDGYAIYSGVDLAVKKGIGHDWSVIYTILVHPDETRQLLWIDRGQWGPMEIVNNINETYERYRGIIFCEDNGAQGYILEWLKEANSKATVIPFTTGANKQHPEYGVEGISVELSKKQWIVPCTYAKVPIAGGDTTGSRNVDLWLREMLYYRRGAHTGDILMACWMAREAARRYSSHRSRSSGITARLIGGTKQATLPSIDTPRHPMWATHSIRGE